MDSLTHIASGALIGEIFLGKQIGKKAMLIGAAAQSLPDIDFVASFWLNTTDDLLAHRGITHSIVAAVVLSAILGLIARRLHQNYPPSTLKWICFFMLETGTHLFLDAFNNYGVGWFEPFSHLRISFNTIFVLDPLYAIWLVIAAVALLVLPLENRRRTAWALFGLGVSSLYLIYGLYHKFEIDGVVRKNMSSRHIMGKSYFSTPTVFNNWLWYVVVKDSSGFLVGYRSVFDRSDSIIFQHFPQAAVLPDSITRQKDFKKLERFSQGFYTVGNERDTLVFSDLRFGQVAGWSNPRAPFVFHYYLNHPEANALVVQRGRMEGWSRKTISDLMERIKGRDN